MDARSIAATAAAGGVLTAATDLPEDVWDERVSYHFDASAYEHRVYQGFSAADAERDLVYGPNIKAWPWPDMEPRAEKIWLRVASKILDDVTTTDALIPSGETSSYRSNPLGLAEFTLSRRDPEYVGRAKVVAELEARRLEGAVPAEVAGETSSYRSNPLGLAEFTLSRRDPEYVGRAKVVAELEARRHDGAVPAEVAGVFDGHVAAGAPGADDPASVEIWSTIYAVNPGDGSAR